MIFLLTSDGYRENLNLDFYCLSRQTLIQGVAWYYKEYFDQETKDFKVNFELEEITFKYLDGFDDWDDGIFYFKTLNKFKNE